MPYARGQVCFAVPTLGDWILSTVFGAFGALGHPFIFLCLFKLGGSEAMFLTVLNTEIFFLNLVLPFSLFIQRAYRQQDVNVGIVTGRIWIMNRHIRTHSIRHKGIRNKIKQQPFPLCFTQLNRQRNHKFTSQAAVLCFFVFLHSISQYVSILPLCASSVFYS